MISKETIKRVFYAFTFLLGFLAITALSQDQKTTQRNSGETSMTSKSIAFPCDVTEDRQCLGSTCISGVAVTISSDLLTVHIRLDHSVKIPTGLMIALRIIEGQQTRFLGGFPEVDHLWQYSTDSSSSDSAASASEMLSLPLPRNILLANVAAGDLIEIEIVQKPYMKKWHTVVCDSAGYMPSSSLRISHTEDCTLQYERLLDSLISGHQDIDYLLLRDCFTRSTYYQPYETELQMLAIKAKPKGDWLTECEAIKRACYPYLDYQLMIAAAYSDGGDDEKALFHIEIFGKLSHEITNSGSGNSLETAWKVINISEEHVLLSILGLEQIDRKSLELAGKYFDVYSAVDKDGKSHSVFFDVSGFCIPSKENPQFVTPDRELSDTTNRDAQKQEHLDPSKGRATFQFEVTDGGNVEIVIFSLSGKKLRTLHFEQLESGNHEISWDGKDDSKQPMQAGFYIYEVLSDGTRIKLGKVLVSP